MPRPDPKFTPGPWAFGREVTYQHGDWEIDYPGSCSYRHIGAASREAAPIALVTGKLTRADDVVIDANARLIAAAPDLYEALKALLPYFEGEHAYDHPESVRARAALAKAEGAGQ